MGCATLACPAVRAALYACVCMSLCSTLMWPVIVNFGTVLRVRHSRDLVSSSAAGCMSMGGPHEAL